MGPFSNPDPPKQKAFYIGHLCVVYIFNLMEASQIVSLQLEKNHHHLCHIHFPYHIPQKHFLGVFSLFWAIFFIPLTICPKFIEGNNKPWDNFGQHQSETNCRLPQFFSMWRRNYIIFKQRTDGGSLHVCNTSSKNMWTSSPEMFSYKLFKMLLQKIISK